MVSQLQARLDNPYPLEYILEETLFCGEWFLVTQDVLIPRPETEVLANCVLQSAGDGVRILDMGTGCGNIAVISAKRLNCEVIATDISEKALLIANKNAIIHRVDNKIKFIKSDWYNSLDIEPADIIVSNPPYIAEEEWDSLPPEVKDYEPRIALWGGKGGLESYGKIISGAKKMLKPDGRIIMEIGCNQAEQVSGLLDGFKEIEVIKDSYGNNRVITAKYYG